jgi:hypothetical protein
MGSKMLLADLEELLVLVMGIKILLEGDRAMEGQLEGCLDQLVGHRDQGMDMEGMDMEGSEGDQCLLVDLGESEEAEDRGQLEEQ